MADLATIMEGPNGSLTATSGVSIAIWNRVEIATDGTYGLAGAASSGEYVAATPTPASGGNFIGRFHNATGNQIYSNDANAIAVGDSIYASANGNVTNTGGTVYLGKARTAAAASTYVEVLRNITGLVAETYALTSAAVATTSPTNSSPYGYTTSAQAAAIVTNLNAVIADVAGIKAALIAMGLPLT